MDPISLALGAVGLGMQIFGGAKQSQDAAKAAQISKDEAMQEQGINNVKQQQMDVEARRMQIENVRNSQRARAMATNAAVQQGASLGSGLQGGLSQISANQAFNGVGTNQAVSFGKQIFGYNNAISADKMQMADVSADSAKWAGVSSLGGAMMKAGPTVGAFGKGFGGFSLFGGGSPSGYGKG